jgi:dCTP deaminase
MQLFSNEDKNNIAKTLLFELIERISRFHLHLEEIRERFYPSNSFRNHPGNTKFHLLDPYNECLIKILHCSLSLSTPLFNGGTSHEGERCDSLINEIQELIHLINQLHRKLGFLPRPPEPPELRRFGRILAKHSMKLSKSEKSEISIYVDENIAEETLYVDPLAEFKEKEINIKINEINKIIGENTIDKCRNELETAGFHVTIPRIDASNSCRWPTLVHELAHKILKSEPFKDYSIEDDFNKFINTVCSEVSLDINANPKIDIKKWLEECWCDLLGAIVMGPAFWFSQASVFIFAGKSEDFGKIVPTHPPHLFRLLLITNILRHRFKDAFFQNCEISLNLYRKLFDYFDINCDDGFLNKPDVRYIFDLFKTYFIDHFFTKNDDGSLSLANPSLNEHIASLIKYTSDIKAEVIDSMVLKLEEGAPVPSYRTYENDSFQERPSHVQEVLFAAWLYRNNKFKDSILKEYDEILKEELSDDSKLWDKFRKTIVKNFRGFNFSVLRSIQVGEWFDLLGGKQEAIDYLKKKCSSAEEERHGTVLADYEIYELLKSEDLLIIPLMNLKEQLGSTSLDIRLGTSFQVFYPNQVGIIDLTDSDSIKNANRFSNLIDLDFMEPITLAPGQFVLGHSMEYIKLPRNISAEVEGRSSFARLGIEVHMTASLVDPGFQGVLTYEIFNAGPNPIQLYPGLRIGQLRFFFGNPPRKPYNKNPTAKYKGLLQHHHSLQSNDYEVELYAREK